MRILIVTDAWAPQVNGVVTTLTNTIRCLGEMGHFVHVIEPSQFRGFSVSLLDGLKIALPPYRMRDRIKNFDAIHIVSEGPLGLAAKRHCDRNKIPYSTAFHTNYATYLKKQFGLSERIGFFLLRMFHRKSLAMMVPTLSMIEVLKKEGFKNAVHWRRGVDGSLFNGNGKIAAQRSLKRLHAGPIWLNVGRVSKEKNLEAFLDLPLHGTKIVVGDGPDLETLKAAYPDVVFLGQLRGAALAEVYRGADVFVFPSRFDTFGLVMAEAISCGTPVAAFPVPGPLDVVEEGVTGALDEDLMAAATRALNIKETRKGFDWMVATQDFVSHLRPVAKLSLP